ncbi:hypothetical protein [Flavobacterium sp. IB48]|uniref:hypothetical protein n=1 Tax=Flavobacterium sp. IB48 TaxID=2779375 RepID=UPI0018E8B7AC|nr:hypothetical protein [Flavobacterium sp. IB48]MBJ2123662.1 hypothetical protein [Flavobacterium sp. IB48]
MKEKLLNEFGKYLIEEVRDDSIFEFNEIVNNNSISKENQYIFELLKKSKVPKEDLIKIVTEMIDKCLFKTLFFFQSQEEFTLTTKDQKGKVINLAEMSDGLSGEIYGENGWIKKFSEYEQIDDWMNNSDNKKKKK